MTDATLLEKFAGAPSPGRDGPESEAGSIESLSAPLSAIAFWSAIALPALYLPLLVAGLDTGQDLGVFLGLFGLHLAALFGGRSHRHD